MTKPSRENLLFILILLPFACLVVFVFCAGPAIFDDSVPSHVRTRAGLYYIVYLTILTFVIIYYKYKTYRK